MSKVLFLLAISVLFFTTPVSAQSPRTIGGTLLASGKKGKALGECPLKNTKVRADISGFITRVRVVQEFQNDFSEPIEAVYTFPLSQNSAVDDMTMTIGERVVRGKIMKRAEARRVYETAKEEGKTASLLDQERANIFTQSVANILPGEKILIEISYVETLKYEDGQYEFVFPMVIGPRYIPSTVKPDEAARISAWTASERPGNDISIEVNLDAGVPVEGIRSISHEIETVNLSSNAAKVTLKGENEIANKDFILRYDVTGKRIEDAVLTHRGERGGFFTLVLQPPDSFVTGERTPKEIVFVLDTSGSMSGRPIEKAKEALNLSLDGLYPDDTFNLITFSGDEHVLFDQPVYATQANLEKARAFLVSREGSGGTEMMKAIKAALDPSDALDHLRIVCFMTDGQVGNDEEIIAEVQKHPRARVFSFGVGDSPNRYLLDKIAQEGKGEASYLTSTDDGSAVAKKFYERVRTPLLTDISVDWGGLAVSDVYPQKLPDLFTAKPVIIHGRYLKPGGGSIRLTGKLAGQYYTREIPVDLPETEASHDVLSTIWARNQVDGLMIEARKYTDNEDPEQIVAQKKAIDAITQLGLDYRLMTQFTSFVAVEEQVTPKPGTMARTDKPRKAKVRVRRGDRNIPFREMELLAVLERPVAVRRGVGYGSGNGAGSGMGYSSGSGSGIGDGSGPVAKTSIIRLNQLNYFSPADKTKDTEIRTDDESPMISTGVVNGKAVELPKPSYPTAAHSVRATGAVAVQVLIDESGKVISANAVSGHPLLRAEAQKAASSARFTSTNLSGQPVKVTGVILYNFINETNVSAAVKELPSHIPGLAEKRQEDLTPTILADVEKARIRANLAEKLQFWVFAAVERMQNGIATPAPNEDKFVRDGKAAVELLFTVRNPETLEKLKELGMRVTLLKGALRVEGAIPVDKLAELAAIEEVKLVLPRML